MERSAYDVVIVGTGFSGLTAALELENQYDLSVCVIGPEKPSKPSNGRFIFSSQKEVQRNPNYRRPGGELQDYFFRKNLRNEFLELENEARELIHNWLKEFGVEYEEYPDSEKWEEIERFIREANKKGISVTISDITALPGINSTHNFLRALYGEARDNCSNVDVKNGYVTDVLPEKNLVVVDSGEKVRYRDAIFLAPGRESTVNHMFDNLKARGYIKEENGEKSLLAGIILEAPVTITPTPIYYLCEPKLTMISGRRDDVVRTYGIYPHGRVGIVNYGRDFKCVSGMVDENKESKNLVIGLMTEIKFTEPFNDTHLYGKRMGENTLMLGDGKPIVQRLGDYEKGRRSTEKRIKNNMVVRPTLPLKDVTPGDISLAYPERVMNNIYDGITKLDAVIEGIAEYSTLMYAPAIIIKPSKINVDPFTMRLKTDKVESEIYVLGDMNGICNGLTDAVISAILGVNSFLKNRV